MIQLGELSLWVAVVMAAWAMTVSFAGGVNRRSAYARRAYAISGARAVVACAVFAGLAATGLWTAFFAHDFSFRFVASHSSWNLPTVGAIAAFWSGPAGSLLFWIVAFTTIAAITTLSTRRMSPDARPWLTGTLGAIALSMIVTVCVFANPYERLDFVPPDGRGLIPPLQQLAAALELPLLLLACASTFAPFAIAVSALAARRDDDASAAALRRSSIVAWCLLSVALLVGMWRAYLQPASSDVGSWRLFELSVLLPWVASSAQLHVLDLRVPAVSARRLSVILTILTALLSFFGAFVLRRGILAETQAYWEYPVGTALLVVLVLATLVSGYLLATRDATSRDASLDTGVEQPENQTPTSPRVRTVGGTVAHVGVFVLAFACVATNAGHDARGTVKTGEKVQATDRFGRHWEFTSQGMSSYEELNRQVVSVTVAVTRDGKPMGLLSSEQRQYIDSDREPTFDPFTITGVLTSPLQDVYLTFEGSTEQDAAAIRVALIPAVWWMWFGGALMVLGGFASMLLSSPTPSSGVRHGGVRHGGVRSA